MATSSVCAPKTTSSAQWLRTPTSYRTFRHIKPHTRDGLWEAMAETRPQVWRRAGATTGTDTVVLDIDASLVEIHSENKVGTAPTYKGGFGYQPMPLGHLPDDDAESVGRAVQVRTDSAGCSQRSAQSCRDRNGDFALVVRSNRAIHAAISLTNTMRAAGLWRCDKTVKPARGRR